MCIRDRSKKTNRAMPTNLRQLFLEHVGQTSDNPMMLEVERAEGVYLYGPDGRRWIDLISGVSVSAVGHGNRRVIDAICAPARDYLHLMVYGEAVESPQVRYAERIASLLPEMCIRDRSTSVSRLSISFSMCRGPSLFTNI